MRDNGRNKSKQLRHFPNDSGTSDSCFEPVRVSIGFVGDTMPEIEAFGEFVAEDVAPMCGRIGLLMPRLGFANCIAKSSSLAAKSGTAPDGTETATIDVRPNPRWYYNWQGHRSRMNVRHRLHIYLMTGNGTGYFECVAILMSPPFLLRSMRRSKSVTPRKNETEVIVRMDANPLPTNPLPQISTLLNAVGLPSLNPKAASNRKRVCVDPRAISSPKVASLAPTKGVSEADTVRILTSRLEEILAHNIQIEKFSDLLNECETHLSLLFASSFANDEEGDFLTSAASILFNLSGKKPQDALGESMRADFAHFKSNNGRVLASILETRAYGTADHSGVQAFGLLCLSFKQLVQKHLAELKEKTGIQEVLGTGTPSSSISSAGILTGLEGKSGIQEAVTDTPSSSIGSGGGSISSDGLPIYNSTSQPQQASSSSPGHPALVAKLAGAPEPQTMEGAWCNVLMAADELLLPILTTFEVMSVAKIAQVTSSDRNTAAKLAQRHAAMMVKAEVKPGAGHDLSTSTCTSNEPQVELGNQLVDQSVEAQTGQTAQTCASVELELTPEMLASSERPKVGPIGTGVQEMPWMQTAAAGSSSHNSSHNGSHNSSGLSLPIAQAAKRQKMPDGQWSAPPWSSIQAGSTQDLGHKSASSNGISQQLAIQPGVTGSWVAADIHPTGPSPQPVVDAWDRMHEGLKKDGHGWLVCRLLMQLWSRFDLEVHDTHVEVRRSFLTHQLSLSNSPRQHLHPNHSLRDIDH
jgi:hypothetical protein